MLSNVNANAKPWTLWRWTHRLFKKIKNAIFLEILKNPFKRLLQWVQNLTNFFLFQISQQIWLLGASKVSAKMGRGWQANWAMAKIFVSNLCKHVMNKCWKFQADILIHICVIADQPKICCNNRPTFHRMQSISWKVGLLLQQIFGQSAITQIWIKISA